MASSPVTYNVEFEERISRLFIFRFLWIYIEMWVLFVWMIWIAVLSFIQVLHMFILGKRNKSIWTSQLRFHRHMVKWQAYLNLLSNGRPKFIED